MRSRAVLYLFRLLLQPCDLNVLLLHLAQQPSTAINSTYRGRHGPAIPRHRLRLANGVFLAVAAGRQQNGCGHGFWESTCLQPSDKCIWQVNSPKLKEGHLSLAELRLEIQSAVFFDVLCACCAILENPLGPFV